jgi:hypothetical protein
VVQPLLDSQARGGNVQRSAPFFAIPFLAVQTIEEEVLNAKLRRATSTIRPLYLPQYRPRNEGVPRRQEPAVRNMPSNVERDVPQRIRFATRRAAQQTILSGV